MRKFYGFYALVLLVGGCAGYNSQMDWYLQGGDVHLVLDWNENRILLEDSKDTIFSGVILSREEKEGMIQLRTRLDKVNEHYADRYPEEFRKDFIIWLKNTSKGVLKVTMTQISSTPYVFLAHPTIETFVPYQQGRFLSEEEIQTFLQDGTAYNIATHFATSIVSDEPPLLSPADIAKIESKPYRRWIKDQYRVSNALSFYQMTDYLQDLDPSTAYITAKAADNLTLEYLINEKKGDIPSPLENPIPIRAIYITTGNLENSGEFSKYRRPKSITIYFSSKNTGGLGSTTGNYNEQSLRIFLTNQKTSHLVYLYSPIFAKNISVHVDSYYAGDSDEMALFDLAFFASNS